jgi:hypothetical protein
LTAIECVNEWLGCIECVGRVRYYVRYNEQMHHQKQITEESESCTPTNEIINSNLNKWLGCVGCVGRVRC